MLRKEMIVEGDTSESVLPMSIGVVEGSNDISEILFCDAISGGANYVKNMPAELSLIRRLDNGTEYRMRYRQIS